MTSDTILDEIISWKRVEIARDKGVVPLDAVRSEAECAPTPRDLTAALRAPGQPGASRVRLIAEVKRASPSKGLLRSDLNPVTRPA